MKRRSMFAAIAALCVAPFVKRKVKLRKADLGCVSPGSFVEVDSDIQYYGMSSTEITELLDGPARRIELEMQRQSAIWRDVLQAYGGKL